MTSIELLIDELIVRGLSPSEASVAATALEARLGALAAQSPRTIRERVETSCGLSPIDIPSRSPAAVGEAVAGALWDALSGDRS